MLTTVGTYCFVSGLPAIFPPEFRFRSNLAHGLLQKKMYLTGCLRTKQEMEISSQILPQFLILEESGHPVIVVHGQEWNPRLICLKLFRQDQDREDLEKDDA